MSLFGELKRRKVFRVAAAYLVAAWLILQVIDVVQDPLRLPEWFATVAIVLLGIGFIIAVMLGWAYEVTPGGSVVRDHGQDDSSGTPPAHAGAGQPRYGIVAFGALLLGMLLAGNIAISLIPNSLPQPGSGDNNLVSRFSIELPRRLREVNDRYRPVAISSDGESVIFRGQPERNPQLFVRPVSRLDVIPIDGTDFASDEFAISGDGQWVVYQDTNDLQIKKVSIDGGIPVSIHEPGTRIWELSWGRNDQILFVQDDHPGLLRVSAAGGEAEEVTAPAGGEFHKHASFIPGTNSIVFTIGDRGTTMRSTDRIAVMSLDTGEQKILMPGASPQVVEPGVLIYYADEALQAAEFDIDRLEVRSESVPLTSGIVYVGEAHYSLADNGTLVYVLATDLVRRSLVYVDLQGNEEPVDIEPRPYRRARISPDGKQLSVVIDAEGGADLWTYSIDRKISTRLTFDESLEAAPVWSNDSRHLVFSSNRVDDIFRIRSDGNGEVEQLTSSQLYQFARSITADDSRLLVYQATSLAGPYDLATLDIGSGNEPELLLESDFNEVHPTISPDGRWLAYVSSRSGMPQVMVRPYPDVQSGVWPVSVDFGALPLWNADSSELYYWGADEMMSVSIEPGPGFQASSPTALFPHSEYVFEFNGNYDFDRTTNRFVFVKRPSEDEIPENRIIVVQNWLQDAIRRLSNDS